MEAHFHQAPSVRISQTQMHLQSLQSSWGILLKFRIRYVLSGVGPRVCKAPRWFWHCWSKDLTWNSTAVKFMAYFSRQNFPDEPKSYTVPTNRSQTMTNLFWRSLLLYARIHSQWSLLFDGGKHANYCPLPLSPKRIGKESLCLKERVKMLSTFFVYLLVICRSSLEKYLFRPFAHFLIWLFIYFATAL